jgi:hypothetical protein
VREDALTITINTEKDIENLDEFHRLHRELARSFSTKKQTQTEIAQGLGH